MREELREHFERAVEQLPEHMTPDEIASCIVALASAYAEDVREIPNFLLHAMYMGTAFAREVIAMEGETKH